MNNNNGIGAYFLGAAIAKGNAERLAEIEAESVAREHSSKIVSYEDRISKIYGWYAESDIRSEVRRRARVLSENAARSIIASAKNGQITISVEEFTRLFAHELDASAANKFFIENAREHAEEFIRDAPKREREIRAALQRIENGE
jgi:hypothetical protein